MRALQTQPARGEIGMHGGGRGGKMGVRSSRSFSIPMEQKVNDGSIVLGGSWPEEKCYRESPPVPVSSNKRGPAVSRVRFSL